jgi:hypothetical protein
MHQVHTQVFIDYTADPVGLIIRGRLWTGQPTSSTTTCPKCGRIGVISARQGHQQTVVHTGHVDGNTLAGIDYCELEWDETDGDGKEAHEEARHQTK